MQLLLLIKHAAEPLINTGFLMKQGKRRVRPKFGPMREKKVAIQTMLND